MAASVFHHVSQFMIILSLLRAGLRRAGRRYFGSRKDGPPRWPDDMCEEKRAELRLNLTLKART